MRDLSIWQGAITSSWSQVWISFLTIVPKVLGAVVVFMIGLLLSFWTKRFIVETLKLIKFEKLVEASGFNIYLKKTEVKLSLSDLVGKLAEWLIIIVFFLAVVDILGLTVVSQVIARVLGYVPNVFAAVLIFAAGYIVANVVNTLVKASLVSIDHEIAKPAGKVARWFVLTVSFFAAVEQLQIAKSLINTFFQGLTYTLVLVIGLSLGLGSKDLVSRILNDWYEKIRK